MYTLFLDLVLDIVVRISFLWWLCVPVLVMGIYALIVRISRGHY